jgi:DNA invertase Pin-like site-specific DNA recombinase
MAEAPTQPGRVFGYIRASTRKQEVSPEVQKYEILRYCEYHRLAEPTFFVDKAVSAKRPLETRAAGKILLARLQPGDHVVCAKLDRMFRKQIDLLQNLERWERTHVSLHIVNFKGGAIDLSSPIGRFLIGILGEVAQLERAYISERTREAAAERERQGLHKCGMARYGFKLVRKNIGGRMRTVQVPDPDERAVMKLILQWRVMDPPLSWHQIRQTLQYERKILTRRGVPWSYERIRAACKREMLLQLREQGLLQPRPKEEPADVE